MKIGISILCGGDYEADYLKGCLKSLRKRSDDVFITIPPTGSDKIQKICKKRGVKFNFFTWVNDFAKARQFGFDSLPKEYDYIFTCDADDIVEGAGNLEAVVSSMKELGADSCYIPYITGRNSERGDTIVNVKRLVERGTGKWVRPIHEVWVSDNVDKAMADHRVQCVHMKQGDGVIKGEQRNLDLLLKVENKTDEDYRYIASSLLAMNNIDEALKYLLLIKPDFGFYYDVLVTISNIYKWKRNLPEGIKTLEKLVERYKEYSDPYFVLGNYFIDAKDYQKALDVYLKGFKINNRMEHIMTASSHGAFINPLGKMAFLFEMLGRHSDALWCVEVLKRIAPDTQKVKDLDEIIRDIDKEEKKDSSDKVSVIITCYNKAPYIDMAIQSALNQTVHNIEVIVIDDRSTDNSVEIIEKIKDPRVKLIKLKKNVGTSAAKNIGIKESTGDYIQILDGDDLLDEKKFERQLGHGPVSFCDYSYVHLGGRDDYSPTFDLDDAYNEILNRWERGLSIAIHAFLYKREVFNKFKFDETLKNHEDWDLHLRVAKEYKFVHIPEVLAYYRVVPDGLSTKKDMKAGFNKVKERYTNGNE